MSLYHMEWNKQILTGFINMYRERPCLWQVTHASYQKKKVKQKALDELVQFLRQSGLHGVNLVTVKTKVQNLRSAFRKEVKKVEEAQRRGDVYEPTLWYYNLLMFTKDQKTRRIVDPSAVNYSDNSENPLDISSEEEGEVKATPDSSQEMMGNASTSKPIPDTPDTLEPDQIYEFMKVCTQLIAAKRNPDEHESFSTYCAVKLKSMSNTQQIYAEHLIHKVITKGMLNTLSERTDVVDLSN